MLNQVKILRVLQLISLLKKPPAKTIKSLAGILNNTERTVYRYLDLIKELGFDLHKDQANRYIILGDFEKEANSFTPEEANLLKELLLSSANKSKLKDSLLKKIYLQSELAIQGNNLLNAHLGKIIDGLSQAINSHKQIVLKGYHSVSSSNISDRMVEPIKFTENYTYICAYEPESKENKFFKIERIMDIEILENNFEHQDKHQYATPDAFGFPPNNHSEPYDIELRLRLRAYILLKEEYPAVGPFIKQEMGKDTYILKVKVNDPKPVLRFIMGLLDEVEVIGSFEFQEYLLGHIGRLFIMHPDDYSPGDTFKRD
jgi:predicted DNA-binding transcriptional regulator YafY